MLRVMIVGAAVMMIVSVTPAAAQDDAAAEATIEALQTRVAELEEALQTATAETPTPTPRPRTPTATPRPRTPTPEPTPTFDEIVADYPAIPDIREVAIRTGSYVGDQIAFSGTVLSIRVAGPGRVFTVGDTTPGKYQTLMQVTVPTLAGDTEVDAVLVTLG